MMNEIKYSADLDHRRLWEEKNIRVMHNLKQISEGENPDDLNMTDTNDNSLLDCTGYERE